MISANPFRQAFTLIELLITMGIIVLILSVTLPAFSRFQKEQDLVSAAETLRDALLETQNLALSPRSQKPDTGDRYRLVLVPQSADTPASYRIEEQVAFDDPNWQQVQQVRLSRSIQYHHISYCGVSQPQIVYAISQQGRIIEPVMSQAGKASIDIVLTSRNLPQSDQRVVEIQLETGRIDIRVQNPPLDLRLCS